jgi:c-di-GMP-binding flagellar brake protein YcgR
MPHAARATPSDAEVSVLDALAAEGQTLSASLCGQSRPFRARLLRVDPEREFLLVGSSGEAGADDAVLRQQAVAFWVEWGEWRISFSAAAPERASDGDRDAIRLRFPERVDIGRRRLHERHAVPAGTIRGVAYSGAVAVFEAAVTDVSEGGLGLQAELVGTGIEPGMVLPGCRIERPDREHLVVDLEVRHTATSTRPDGRRLWRAGCRFVNLAPEARKAVGDLAGHVPH